MSEVTPEVTPEPPMGLAAFSRLLMQLEQADGTHARRDALVSYFRHTPAADAAWAVWLLSGERLRRVVPVADLKRAAIAVSGLPEWAFEECYQSVGDLAETIALLVGQTSEPRTSVNPYPEARVGNENRASLGLADWIEQRLLPLRRADPQQVQAAMIASWAVLPTHEVFCLNKLLTGGLRVGVSRSLVAAALSALTGVPGEVMATRLMRMMAETPSAEAFARLLVPSAEAENTQGPLPFFLAQSLVLPADVLEHPDQAEATLQERLGPSGDWLVEWKWDGIRAQVIARPHEVQIWSRGEELVTDMFPELTIAMQRLASLAQADLLLDGEILVWDHARQRPQPFSALQTRLGRKKPSARFLAKAPAVLMAYDLLRFSAEDLRTLPFAQRRERLVTLLEAAESNPMLAPCLRLSQAMPVSSWREALFLRAQAQMQPAEGLMLKHLRGSYGQGRQKKTAQGECWKWKRDPFVVDAVLVYAQRGHGRRAGLYTDYGFALWDDRRDPPALVPFAKAYSGLTDAEIRQVDQVIRKTIIEKFGPVRQVTPSLVMELGFEGVMTSGRHKSGYAVRFPRILRLRPDKTVDQADRFSALEAFLGEAIC
jgi:DNA ligase-1